MTWSDGTTTPRTASRISVGETYINVDAPAYGGNIQTAINSVTAATIYIPGRATTRVQTTALTYPAKISFLGDGQDASVLSWPTDLGVGTWALQPSAAVGSGPYHNNFIADIGLRGSSYGAALVPGTRATNQNGIRIARRTTVRRCTSTGFGYGLAVSEDHAQVYDSDIGNNHCNVVWLSCPVQRYGNIVMEDVRADGASLCGAYVENNNCITDSHLIRFGFGRSPYGILSAPGRSETRFIVNTKLDQTGAESCGNGFIYGQNTTDKIENTQILWMNGNIDAAFRLPATVYRAWIEAGSCSRVFIDAGISFPTDAVPSLAGYYMNASGGWGDTVISNISADHLDYCQNNAFPFIGGSDLTPIHVSFTTVNGGAGIFIRTSAVIAKGDLMRLTTSWTGLQYDTAGQIPLGYARYGIGANLMCPIITSGPAFARTDAAGISGIKYLKPSATAGRVAEATTYADGPIVGSTAGAVAANGTFNGHTNLGAWNG